MAARAGKSDEGGRRSGWTAATWLGTVRKQSAKEQPSLEKSLGRREEVEEEGEEREEGGGISAAAAFTCVWNVCGVSHHTHTHGTTRAQLAGGLRGWGGSRVRGQPHVVTHLESYYPPPSGVCVFCSCVCLRECVCVFVCVLLQMGFSQGLSSQTFFCIKAAVKIHLKSFSFLANFSSIL